MDYRELAAHSSAADIVRLDMTSPYVKRPVGIHDHGGSVFGSGPDSDQSQATD